MSKGKFYWDVLIILLSLLNAIYVPIEIAFNKRSTLMDIFNHIIDSLFMLDILVNFRTIYFDSKTLEPISDSKMIAKNYVKGGRFFIDLLCSLPIEAIA